MGLTEGEPEATTLLSNIPYAITSPLLIHLLTGRFNFSLLVVMVQLEVAARLVAAPGDKDYGALSVFVQYYTRPEKLFRVPRTVFIPRPGWIPSSTAGGAAPAGRGGAQ